MCNHIRRIPRFPRLRKWKLSGERIRLFFNSPNYSAIFIYLSDAFTHLLDKICEIFDKISHKRKATA